MKRVSIDVRVVCSVLVWTFFVCLFLFGGWWFLAFESFGGMGRLPQSFVLFKGSNWLSTQVPGTCSHSFSLFCENMLVASIWSPS